MKQKSILLVVVILTAITSFAQDFQGLTKNIEALQKNDASLDQRIDQLAKQMDDLM